MYLANNRFLLLSSTISSPHYLTILIYTLITCRHFCSYFITKSHILEHRDKLHWTHPAVVAFLSFFINAIDSQEEHSHSYRIPRLTHKLVMNFILLKLQESTPQKLQEFWDCDSCRILLTLALQCVYDLVLDLRACQQLNDTLRIHCVQCVVNTPLTT